MSYMRVFTNTYNYIVKIKLKFLVSFNFFLWIGILKKLPLHAGQLGYEELRDHAECTQLVLIHRVL